MRGARSLSGAGRLKWFGRVLRATHSLRCSYHLSTPRRALVDLAIRNGGLNFQIRTGTSDARLLREAVVHNFDFPEYRVPIAVQPRTVLDIGANIGVVSVCLNRSYPNARLLAFEPEPNNFRLLQRNIGHLPKAVAVPFGLGAETRKVVYHRSDDDTNPGGGSVQPTLASAQAPQREVHILTPLEAIERYQIEHVDLIKIDTEGSEYEILTSFPADVLGQVRVIVGELHGVNDEELVAHLDRWFDVERKALHGRLSLFKAVNVSAPPRSR